MNLIIDNLLPSYFEESRKESSEIWGKKLVFSPGSFVKIVAPSGSGKTSLIHFLYGMRNDYSGTIKYEGLTSGNLKREELAKLRQDTVSVVFQDLRLFPEQTVFDNLEIKRALNPYHESSMIKTMAARLGIESKLSSPIVNCSYGEQQRVAIIRALLQPYKILLLDEPFSHLDNNNASKAMDLMLSESRRRDATILFADLERVDFFPYTSLYHL